jgi:hypothetical protein
VASSFPPRNELRTNWKAGWWAPAMFFTLLSKRTSIAPARIRTLDHPASSQSLYCFAVPAPYCSVVFTEWDMIRIGELAQMWYLRLLLGLTVLDCRRNCNILNGLKIDNVVPYFPAHKTHFFFPKNVKLQTSDGLLWTRWWVVLSIK